MHLLIQLLSTSTLFPRICVENNMTEGHTIEKNKYTRIIY